MHNYSKSSSLAHNTQRDSGYHSFDVGQDILVGNNLPIGSPSIDQSVKGVDYPNVQDAVKDLSSLYELPINTVLINTDGIQPGGVSQVDVYRLTGNVNTGDPVGTPVNLDLFGITIPVLAGDTADEVATKAKVVLDTLSFQNKLFSSVAAPVPSEIQVKYIDYKNHVLKPYTCLGIGVEQIINSPARTGFGNWIKIGTQTVQLSGQPDHTIFYFKRVS